jgi:hypothetical protein
MRRPSVSRMREIRTYGLKGNFRKRSRRATAPEVYQCPQGTTQAGPAARRRRPARPGRPVRAQTAEARAAIVLAVNRSLKSITVPVVPQGGNR